MSSRYVWTAEVSALNGAGAAQTLRFATEPYTDGSANYFDGRLKGAPSISSQIVGSLFHRVEAKNTAFGNLVLANADGQLNYLLDYAFDGRPFVFKLVDRTTSTTYNILTATMLAATYSNLEVIIGLRDAGDKLRNLHPVNRYLGTGGREGGANLTGKVKPKVYGRVFGFTPVLVDFANKIYQLSDNNCTVSLVYDSGIQLTSGGVDTSYANLVASSPAAGAFRRYSGTDGTYIKLGSNPTGKIFCNSVTHSSGPNIFSAVNLLLSEISYTYSDPGSDFSEISGVLLREEKTTFDLLSDLIDSEGGAWWVSNSVSSQIVISFLERNILPPDPLAAEIKAFNIKSIKILSTGMGKNGLPYAKTISRFQRNYDPHRPEDFAAAATNDIRQSLSQEIKKRETLTTMPSGRHPLGETYIFGGCNDTTTGRPSRTADGTRTDWTETEIGIEAPALSFFTTLGQELTLATPRLGYSAGKRFIIARYVINPARNSLTLTLLS